MTSSNVEAWAAVIGVLLTVIGIGVGIKAGTRSRAQSDQAARDKIRTDAEQIGYDRARSEFEPKLALEQSERRNAERDRDAFQRRSDEFEARYLNIRDRGKDS